MKINGEFVLREIAGEIIILPVGKTALKMNGMITLDPVAALIWQGLTDEKDEPQILSEILDRFDVEEQQALADMKDFINQLREADLLLE